MSQSATPFQQPQQGSLCTLRLRALVRVGTVGRELVRGVRGRAEPFDAGAAEGIVGCQRVRERGVAARAGHASVVTVLDRYGHLLPGSEDRVNDALDAMADAVQTAPLRVIR